MLYKKRHLLPALGIFFSCTLGLGQERKEEYNPLLHLTPLPDKSEGAFLEQELLMHYLAYQQEGENLLNRCESYPWPEFANTRRRELVARTIMSAYQSLGLAITIPAILEYSKALGHSPPQRKQLAKNLVQQYCSPNISIISHAKLLKYFTPQGQKSSSFLLPQLNWARHFPPETLQGVRKRSEVLAQELRQTIALFRSFCSWGGEALRPRLLSFLFQDPGFSALVIRRLAGLEIKYHATQKARYLGPSQDTIKINCQGAICRHTDRESFTQQFLRLLGGTAPMAQMESFYCHHLRYLKPRIHSRHPTIQSWAKQTSEEDRLLMASQLSALITGVPELLLRVQHYKDFANFMRPLYRQSWDAWARRALGPLAQQLLYEESLALVKLHLPRHQRKPFGVKFQVALGEFDQALGGGSNLKAHYSIQISQKILGWVRANGEAQREKALRILQQQIEDQVAVMSRRFIIAPWEGNIAGIIAQEIFIQLAQYKGNLSLHPGKTQIKIPIHFEYGPFALKYLHFKRRQGG